MSVNIHKSTTAKLSEILLNVENEDSLKQYLNQVSEKHAPVPFHVYFSSLDQVKQMDRSELVRRSGIERTYCYHILNGTRPKPGRDKILRLCIAAGLDLSETKKALEAAEEAVLYVKNQRDAVIIYSIQQKLNVMETNELLDSLELKPLD